jgi:hypothetical protein
MIHQDQQPLQLLHLSDATGSYSRRVLETPSTAGGKPAVLPVVSAGGCIS